MRIKGVDKKDTQDFSKWFKREIGDSGQKLSISEQGDLFGGYVIQIDTTELKEKQIDECVFWFEHQKEHRKKLEQLLKIKEKTGENKMDKNIYFKDIIGAIGSFELLKKYEDLDNPLAGVAEEIISRIKPQYSVEELDEMLDIVSKIYSEHNILIGYVSDRFDEKRRELEEEMRNRFDDEYDIMYSRGLSPDPMDFV